MQGLEKGGAGKRAPAAGAEEKIETGIKKNKFESIDISANKL